MTVHLDPDLQRLAFTYASRLRGIKEAYVGREDAIDIIGTAAICREHVLLIGPPGTAKTAVLERFCAMLAARYFSYLLTKFTEPAELFGSVDVPSFQRDSVYRVNTEGKLPTVDIAFLDEIFHGSSAILNTLLTLINERVFHNGSTVEPANLVTLLGAANEIPDDPLLQAFCDRFLFRCRLDYVADDEVTQVLEKGWVAEQALINAATGGAGAGGAGAAADAAPRVGGFAMADLLRLQRATATIDLSGVREELAKILLGFRDEAIAFSDRRAVKAQKAIAACALLDGRGSAETADLAVLVQLWANPQDEASIRRVVESHGVPVSGSGAQRRDLEEILYELRQLRARHEVVASGEECREILRCLGRLLAELRCGHPHAHEALRAVQRAQTEVITTIRERFSQDGGFDV